MNAAICSATVPLNPARCSVRKLTLNSKSSPQLSAASFAFAFRPIFILMFKAVSPQMLVDYKS